MVKFGVTSSVFVNYLIPDIIPFISKAGFNGIDIWGGRPHIYRNDYDRKDLLDIKRTLDNVGLEVSSFMPAFFRYPHSLSNPKPVVRKDSIDYMCICADNAMALGANLLLIVPGRSVYKQDKEDAFILLLDSINKVCEYCEQYDFVLGIEPANKSVTDLVVTHQDAMRVVREINNKSLGVVMDSGHMNLNGETVNEVINNLGTSLLQFHVNDNDGVNQQNLIPGKGGYDFNTFYESIKSTGFQGYTSVELGWHYTVDPLPAVEEALKNMQKFAK